MNNEIAMAIDTTFTLTLTLAAKVMSKREIDAYFQIQRDRLVEQDFSTLKEIDKFIKLNKTIVLTVKDGLNET